MKGCDLLKAPDSRMPGSMLSWESEDYLVEEYEGLIKARTNTVWESKGPMHFGEVVIAIALRRTALGNCDCASGNWRHIRDHLRKTLRVLDALHTIATEELKQNKKFVIPGVAQLKVKDQRPKKAAKPKGSKATTVKAFPTRAFKKAVLLFGELINREGGTMMNTDG